MTIPITSKLPGIGTTIFTIVSQRARELGAINLAQGFPDYDAPARLKDLVAFHVAAGHNQYAPMAGVPALREQIALKFAAQHGRLLDPDDEVTVTLGATEGLFSSILALLHAGDEAIVFDPAYDSYAPAVVLAGARPVHLPLEPPGFRIDWQRVREAVTPKTRLLIINNPHNPTSTVLDSTELDLLADVLRGTRVLVLADEVYEHMVFDGRRHVSVCAHPELADRSIGVYSFGKTMHATGWRVGYCIAPPVLTRELRRVHQFNTFSVVTPLQLALADFLKESPGHCAELGDFYESKRNRFLELLRGSSFSWTPAEGTYFQLLNFSAVSDRSDVEFAERLIRGAGVAAIPLSPFYATPVQVPLLRFCFAKNESTLEEAAERLCRL
jgi:methionine aminotransferase